MEKRARSERDCLVKSANTMKKKTMYTDIDREVMNTIEVTIHSHTVIASTIATSNPGLF
jgi:hypothetical protein